MAPKSRLRVLFIEERPAGSGRLQELLAEPEASILDVSAASWDPEALKRVVGKRFDVALLEFGVLDARALKTVEQLHARVPLLPIVVVSDHAEDEVTVEVMRAGADDHLKHGDLNAMLLARALTFAVARNVRMRKKAAAPASREVQMTAGVILDRLPMGVVLVDATGKVLLMNRKAREIAAQNDGFLVDKDGCCRTAKPAESQALADLILRTMQPGVDDPVESEFALSLSRPSLKQPLLVLVSPVGGAAGGTENERRGAAIFITDPEDATEISVDVLSRLYGLTNAEARVVKALSEGKRLETFAEETGVTTHTVRHQLKQIFRKTDTTRQSELIKLVLTGPAAIRAQAETPKAAAPLSSP